MGSPGQLEYREGGQKEESMFVDGVEYQDRGLCLSWLTSLSQVF